MIDLKELRAKAEARKMLFDSITVIALLDRLEKAETALKLYADQKNWMINRKDDLHETKRTIIGDVETFGYQRDEYSSNILQIIAGKTAREYFKEVADT